MHAGNTLSTEEVVEKESLKVFLWLINFYKSFWWTPSDYERY